MSEARAWERQKGESRQAFAAFCAYRDLGTPRTIAKASREHNKAVPTLNVWSAKWRWVERSAAYDAHMARLEQAAREAALVEEAEKWARRRLEEREREYDVASRLFDRALAMLEHPMTRTKGEDGKTVVPAGWRQVDIAAIADTAAKLARLATEMETERTKHDLGDVDPLDAFTRAIDGLAARVRAEEADRVADAVGGGGAAI